MHLIGHFADTLTRFVEYETAADLKQAVEKLDGQEFKGNTVHCVADVGNALATALNPAADFLDRSKRSPRHPMAVGTVVAVRVRRPAVTVVTVRRPTTATTVAAARIPAATARAVVMNARPLRAAIMLAVGSTLPAPGPCAGLRMMATVHPHVATAMMAMVRRRRAVTRSRTMLMVMENLPLAAARPPAITGTAATKSVRPATGRCSFFSSFLPTVRVCFRGARGRMSVDVAYPSRFSPRHSGNPSASSTLSEAERCLVGLWGFKIISGMQVFVHGCWGAEASLADCRSVLMEAWWL